MQTYKVHYNNNMKYGFEKYEYNHKGIIFKGYIYTNAESSEQALLSCQEIVGEEIKLFPIYVENN